MKISKMLFIAALAAGTAQVFAGDLYQFDERHTYPSFSVKHLGFSFQGGRFNKSSGSAELDMAAGKGSVSINIDAKSIDMGIDKWDEHVRSEDFLDADKHPEITFNGDKMSFKDGKPVAVEGVLNLRGVSKPVTFNITNFSCGAHPMNKKQTCGANAEAQIKRSDFGMSKMLPGIADEVSLKIAVEAFKQ